MGGLGSLRHSGPEGNYNRNASRNATLNYIRTSGLPRTFYNQLQESWHELALGWGGTETTHTMDDKEARETLKSAQFDLLQRLYARQLETPQRYAWAALLLSNAAPGSGRWLEYTGGTAKRFRMEDSLFKDALRQRCMLSPSEAAQMAATRCHCSPAAQQHVTHLLDCKVNQWYYTHRHNTACELLAALIRRIRPDVIIRREMSVWQAAEEEGGDGEEDDEGGDGAVNEEVRAATEDEGGAAADEQGGGVQEEERSDAERENDRGAGVGDASADERGEGAQEDEGQEAAAGEDEGGDAREEPTGENIGEEVADTSGEGGGDEAATPATTEDARAPVDAAGGTVGAPAASVDNRRSDLVCVFPHAVFTIDMSIVNPGCRKYIRRSRSHMVDGAASAERENEKRAKYADVPGVAEGGGGGFVPFVVEATGRLGKAARRFLKDIASVEDTFHLSNFFSALSALCALHLSMMVKSKMRKFSELERIEF